MGIYPYIRPELLTAWNYRLTKSRCAIHFATPDKRQNCHSLQSLFEEALVYVSDGITRSTSIRLNNQTIKGVTSAVNFHIQESEGRLRLYLPSTEVGGAVRQLSRTLLTFLNIFDQAAENVVSAIIRQSNLAVIDEILNHAGVAGIVLRPPRRQSSDRLAGQELAYRSLLDHVVDLARNRVACDFFLSTDFFSFSGESEILVPLDDGLIDEAIGDEDWKFRIGAAGELYVLNPLPIVPSLTNDLGLPISPKPRIKEFWY